MRILLADDDHDQLELRSLLLTRSGYETIPVTTTAAALLAAEEQWPECAVLDLKLPTEAMGLSLIRALKSLDAAMRIFVLTGSDPKRINALPEKKLVEEVIVKGSSTAYLMKKLGELAGSAEPKLALFRETLARANVVAFDVKAVPRAARSEVVGVTTDGAMKVRLAAVPDKGKANEELRAVLAGWFQVPKSNV
jgi:CheY-like chemotaxis protein